MEVFEVHITGDESIHEVAKRHDYKTIAVDLLRPDKSVIRTEHMTSLIFKYPFENMSFERCKALVYDIVRKFEDAGVKIIRVKIECPFYDHYRKQSLYMESHFITEETTHPLSRNRRKTTLLGTDRTYNRNEYVRFKNKYEGKEVELCLHDTFPDEDKDWFDCYQSITKVVTDDLEDEEDYDDVELYLEEPIELTEND